MNLHCEGCIQKIRRIVGKAKGYQEMSLDRQKDLVTVKGTMDMKALADSLNKKLKRPVDIVPPKKEGGGGEKKEKGGGGDGGEKKEKGGGGGGEKTEKGGGESKVAGDGGGGKVEPYGHPYPHVYGPGYAMEHPHPHVYGSGYAMEHPHHAPQFFSDENPNACSVM
uniref:HMA domain-containing protein n=2 Tax=Davidia involucrata TaxID=16924 RepID=A0A5B6ZF32_DAVIN